MRLQQIDVIHLGVGLPAVAGPGDKPCVIRNAMNAPDRREWRGGRVNSRQATQSRSLIVALAGIGIVVFSISVWIAIARNLDFPWTSIRLAPAFALAHGIPLYSIPDRGPWVMVGYGPLYPLAYLPSVLARDPRSAVTVATLLAHLFVLAPAGLVFSLLGKRQTEDQSVRHFPWPLLLLLFALITHLVPSLVYVTAGVHADAPAIGFFLLAGYAVLRAGSAGDINQIRWLVGAGLAAGLTAACKLNFAAVAVALLIWVARFFGWKRAALFMGASLLAALTVYVLAAWRDGLSPVLLNLREPGSMPWFTVSEIDLISPTGSSHELSEKGRTFLAFSRDYLKVYGPIALATIVVLSLLQRDNARTCSASRAAWFFLFLSFVLLPASIASISKYGGDVNSRALVSLPLTLAAIVALAGLIQRGHRAATGALYAALAGAIFMDALPLKDGWAKASPTQTPTLVEAYTVISADPGRWYYPYDPLAHFLVEGKFRPNMDVIYSYAASGSPVDPAAFQSELPENLRYIAIPPSVGSWGVSEIRRLLSDYSTPAPELSTARHRFYSR